MTSAFGCLVHLALLSAVAFGLDRYTAGDVAPALRPWVALAASTMLVLGLSNVVHLLGGHGQGDASRATLVARATTGEPPPDGGPMMVTGRARPEDGVPLRSPITGTPCVAYLYNVHRRHRVKGGYDRTPVWFGVAAQPFVVETGARAVRVLAMPDIQEASEDVARSPDVVARVQAYTQHTRFEDVPTIAIGGTAFALFSDMKDVHPRGLRRDWRRTGATDDVATLRMEESLVPVGETISVAGHWSPEHHAIVAERTGLTGARVTIARGDPRGLLGRATAVPASARAVAVFAVLLIAAGLGVLWAIRAGYLAAGLR